jgi:predicted RNase H-like HicB family nuclease
MRMQFTVILTKKPDAPWRAGIPILPGCEAEGATREEALAAIKQRLAATAEHIELVQIEAPRGVSLNGEMSEKSFAETWPGFGAFRDDPWLNELFDEIERQRDATATEENFDEVEQERTVILTGV